MYMQLFPRKVLISRFNQVMRLWTVNSNWKCEESGSALRTTGSGAWEHVCAY